MRFTSIIVAGAVAMFASAQDTTSTSSVAATAATTDAAQASTIACLDACKDGDVTCEAKCIAVSVYRLEDLGIARVSVASGAREGNLLRFTP